MFTIRIYGILIVNDTVLLLQESFKGHHFTKFPGGGLQFGEGTADCLKREFKEELNCDIEILSHFYTTDFFQLSAFNSNIQVLSIYYLVKNKSRQVEIKLVVSPGIKGATVLSLEWIELKNFSEDSLTFPIDKVVAGMVKKKFS